MAITPGTSDQVKAEALTVRTTSAICAGSVNFDSWMIPEMSHCSLSQSAAANIPLITTVEMAGTGAQVCSMKNVLLAVSATNLQGTYYPDKETFTWLKTRKPVFVAGYSIFIYDLTSDKDGLARLAALFDREGRNSEADCLYARAGKQEAP